MPHTTDREARLIVDALAWFADPTEDRLMTLRAACIDVVVERAMPPPKPPIIRDSPDGPILAGFDPQTGQAIPGWKPPDHKATLSWVPSADSTVPPSWHVNFDRDFAEEVMAIREVNTNFMAPELVYSHAAQFLAENFFEQLREGDGVTLDDVRRYVARDTANA